MTEIKRGGYAMYIGEYSPQRNIGDVCRVNEVYEEENEFQVHTSTGYYESFAMDSDEWIHLTDEDAKRIFEQRRNETIQLAAAERSELQEILRLQAGCLGELFNIVSELSQGSYGIQMQMERLVPHMDKLGKMTNAR